MVSTSTAHTENPSPTLTKSPCSEKPKNTYSISHRAKKSKRHKGTPNPIEKVWIEHGLIPNFPASQGVTQTVRLTFSLPLGLNMTNEININNVFVRLIIFQQCSSPQGGFQSTLTIIYIWKSFFPKEMQPPLWCNVAAVLQCKATVKLVEARN